MDESTRPSLNEVAECLSAIIEDMEDQQNLKSILERELPSAFSDIQRGVDKRKALVREIDSKIALAKSLKDTYGKEIKRYEGVREGVVHQMKQLLEKNPNVPFTDSLGKRLTLQRNAQPKLILTDPNSIPEEFCTFKKEIDKNKLREAITNSPTLADRLGVRLEFGTQLRGLK